ncbi:hypothetical protein [Bacillus sp. FJAT-26390]|uniref:hypothetical protein n=1 Tax=Bacillus sp. FJAT-26390 TaxID=1743142 RepID=UPI000807A59D|nr:hypothetical protein [Bacillus sp. FJAT-26390]OBZ08622.1 hypothetical protein A7975_26440 [Bacillus sp. FJAT-26390]
MVRKSAGIGDERMTIAKMLRNVSFGLIFGVLAIGLLPFLVIFNWAEMLNLVELETSPLFILLGRFIGPVARKGSTSSTSRPEQKKNLDQ